jgi:hypothetical protein
VRSALTRDDALWCESDQIAKRWWKQSKRGRARKKKASKGKGEKERGRGEGAATETRTA